MTLDLFLISTSISLVVMSVILITMFAMLNRSLVAYGELLRQLSPVIGDLRAGVQQLNRMSEALGNIGDDLEEGRRAVKGTVEGLAALSGPVLGIIKLFRRK